MTTTVNGAHAGPGDRRKWLGLAALCSAFFMVILDVAIVNVALPTIQVDLDFSQKNLQWVVSAYALTFGGLLLLGGRAADLLGRRRVFIAGLAIFSAASLLAGLAPSDTVLIGGPGPPGRRRRGHDARRSVDPDDHLPRRAPSATRRSASGAPWAPRAGPWACSSAASSPTRSAGSGSSSSTSRSGWR